MVLHEPKFAGLMVFVNCQPIVLSQTADCFSKSAGGNVVEWQARAVRDWLQGCLYRMADRVFRSIASHMPPKFDRHKRLQRTNFDCR